MALHQPDEDEGYDSIDEDAELELSCALQDLALRVKSFEENMKGRFHQHEDEEEITEDIPEMEDWREATASPKDRKKKRYDRGRKSAKSAKQQDDDDEGDDDDVVNDSSDDGGEFDDDEDHEPQGKDTVDTGDYTDEEWNEGHEKKGLSELKHNIALLLQGMKEEAKALEMENQ